MPTPDNLRDQITAALVAHHTNGLCPTAGPCEDCDCFDPQHTRELADADAVMPVFEAALAEARREALMDAADAIQALHPGEVKASVTFLRARAAGEHDTPAGEPDIPLAPSGRKVQRRQSIPPTQNPVTPMVVGADGREAARKAAGRNTRLLREIEDSTPPARKPSDCQNQAIGECSPAEPCSPNCPPAQQPAGPDVDTGTGREWTGEFIPELAATMRRQMAEDGAGPMYAMSFEILAALLDALDARDAEIRELRDLLAFQAHAHAHQLDERMALARKFEQQRDDAIARLAEIRALCDASDRDDPAQAGILYVGDVRAVLDRGPADA